MKKFSVLFLFILIFAFIFVSCKTEPEVSDSVKTVVERDENGHLMQIDYYKNGSLYKINYYQYLNEHDSESRLIKTVENGQVIYEMEECWKVAYALQNNTYRYYGELYSVYPTKREYFGSIDEEKNTISYIRVQGAEYTYNIEDGKCISKSSNYHNLQLLYLEDGKYEITFTDDRDGDGNRYIFTLAK